MVRQYVNQEKSPIILDVSREAIEYCGFAHIVSLIFFLTILKQKVLERKSKELEIGTYISSKCDKFIHGKPFYADLENGCCSTKRRIDLRKLTNNTMLCLEVDENQHKYYIISDENNRYDELFMDFNVKCIYIYIH